MPLSVKTGPKPLNRRSSPDETPRAIERMNDCSRVEMNLRKFHEWRQTICAYENMY